MPPLRAAGYVLTAVTLALAQGFGQNMISANVQQLQGAFGATQAETSWLVAAYMAPNVSLSVALIKIRTQYGLRNFAELSIVAFIGAALLNYAADDLWTNLAVRFVSGVAAAPMTSLAFLYMLEWLQPQRKMTIGLAAALTVIFMGSPLTRLVSPHLLDVGLWHGLTALEVALAAIGLGLIYLFPLASPPRQKCIEAADVISFLLIAASFGAFAVAFTLGPIYWWGERDWLGWLLAAGIGAFAAAACIELNRRTPLLDIRWLASPEILHFAAALLLFRLVLSEQTSGAGGLFRALGLLNEQTRAIWAIVLAATVAGGAACALLMRPGREPWFHAAALSLLVAGSLMDARATAAIAPSQMYVSQAMIGLAGALFLPPAMASGMRAAMARGREYILSFIVVFLTTQKVGGLLGGALFASVVQHRQRLHLQRLGEALPTVDPLVSERLSALAGAHAGQVSDPARLSAWAGSRLAAEAAAQASVMAYDDAFLIVACVSGAALALLLGHMALMAARERAARERPDPPRAAPPAGAPSPRAT